MAFSKVPSAFFGAGYSLASNAISFLTATEAATYTVVGTTFQGEADDNTLTTAAPHGLRVGDRVRVAVGTTLPTGLAAATDYFVKTVVSTTMVTLSATYGGAAIDLTTDGTADNTLRLMTAPLDDLTDTDANATTGDWRKIIVGVMEMFYKKWIRTPSVDRSTKLTVAKSTGVSGVNTVITYTVRVTLATVPPSAVADE